MNRPYMLKMSDGRVLRIEGAASAGDAITQGLWQCRAVKVVRCYQGFDAQDNKGIFRDTAGGIEYEVPPHDPVAVDAKKPVHRKQKDHSELMPFMQEGSK